MIARIRSEVQADLQQAFNYYAARRVGYGAIFLTEFSRALDKVLANPGAWARLKGNHHRCQLRRFPYVIIYHFDKQRQELTVTSLFMMHRRPSSWRGL